MMHKNKSNRWMMTKAIVLPALMALAVVAFAKSKAEGNLQDTQNSSEKLITFKEDDPNRFAITIPKGIWREAKYTGVTDKGKTYDVNKSFIQENTTKSPYWGPEGVTLKLNGKVVDPHELADIPASELKKMEQNAHEREINLITESVQIPFEDDTTENSKEALILISNNGKLFVVNIPVGTWVESQNGDKKESYIVKQPIKSHQFFDPKTATVKLDGKVVDIHSLTNKSRSNLKKVEIDFSSHDEINLITTPVQIPDNLKTK